MLGKTRACATVVPVLQLRVLRDKWYHSEVFAAVTIRQLKGNRETGLREQFLIQISYRQYFLCMCAVAGATDPAWRVELDQLVAEVSIKPDNSRRRLI